MSMIWQRRGSVDKARLMYAGAVLCLLVFPVSGENALARKTKMGQHGHLRADGHDRVIAQVSSSGATSKDDKEGNPMLLGILLWLFVPCLLWNNERIAIKQYKIQYKAERYAIHIDDPEREPLDEMDGRIVYVAGVSKCTQELTDDVFPAVRSDGKIKLRRKVEMYQWVEKEREEGEGDNKRTVYYWTKEWRDSHQECPHGGADKENPPMPMPSTRRQKAYKAYYDILAGEGSPCQEAAHENVRVGAYYLGDYVIRELLQWKTKEDVTAEMLQDRRTSSPFEGQAILDDGYWYFSDSRNDIGAVRVQFEELVPGPTSIVGVLTQTEKGWTFVPVKRADDAGIGDGAAVEICGSCCFRVKELHYGDQDDDESLKADLQGRGPELTRTEKKAFNRAATTGNVEEYNMEDEMGDLCCVGPFGYLVVRLLHWLGIEEEFLAVREKNMSLDKVMAAEGREAGARHNYMRLAGLVLLVFASYSIISPIVKVLNANWLTSMLGGGLLSGILICFSCLCSISCFSCIVSFAWIFYRPFLAVFGIAVASCIYAGVYYFIYESNEVAKRSPPPGSVAAFMAVEHAVGRLLSQL